MAPLNLQPHSCSYCQTLVLDFSGQEPRMRGDMAKNGVLFSCTYSDIIQGADRGCQFYSWLLEEEVISRDTVLRCSPNDLPRNDPFWNVLDALQDSAMWVPEYLGEALPRNSLRHIEPRVSVHLKDHRLIATTNLQARSRVDVQRLEFFGLWNPETTKIDYRTRHGFEVFTDSDNPAARTVTTRPIEGNPAADHSITRISSWLQTSQSTHANCQNLSAKMPTRFLQIGTDNSQRSLRLLNSQSLGSARYAALSYCWGGEQSVTCTNFTISKFQAGFLVSNLPATIQDAVTVCCELGVPYLWVDALCIIQDDFNEKTIEMSKMPYIYGNAFVTIAAASPRRVEDGFLNERAIPSPVSAFTLPFRCHDDVLGSVTILILDITPEPLDERGWTLQEGLLSNRILEFGTRSTRWYCRAFSPTVRCSDGWKSQPEYSPLKSETLDIVNFQQMNQLYLARDRGRIIADWERVVRTYTHRKISQPTDRPHAISGIAEVFGHILQNQYRAGLWAGSMHAGLLWQISEKTRMPRPIIYQGPSWSWVGVNGTVDVDGGYNHSQNGFYQA